MTIDLVPLDFLGHSIGRASSLQCSLESTLHTKVDTVSARKFFTAFDFPPATCITGPHQALLLFVLRYSVHGR